MFMEKPLVSVIMPVYNAEEYLEEAVNSAIVSNYSPLELILVDDGSTDGVTGELCDKLAWYDCDKGV